MAWHGKSSATAAPAGPASSYWPAPARRWTASQARHRHQAQAARAAAGDRPRFAGSSTRCRPFDLARPIAGRHRIGCAASSWWASGSTLRHKVQPARPPRAPGAADRAAARLGAGRPAWRCRSPAATAPAAPAAPASSRWPASARRCTASQASAGTRCSSAGRRW